MHLHELLGRINRVYGRHGHLLHALEALAAEALHTGGRVNPLHDWMEPVFKLPVNRLDFLLERVVNSNLALAHVLALELLHWTTHLLLVVLDEGRLGHVDPVLALDLLAVVQQEGLVASKLLLYRLNRHLVNSGSDLECLHG